jgi:hypothetical protein
MVASITRVQSPFNLLLNQVLMYYSRSQISELFRIGNCETAHNNKNDDNTTPTFIGLNETTQTKNTEAAKRKIERERIQIMSQTHVF